MTCYVNILYLFHKTHKNTFRAHLSTQEKAEKSIKGIFTLMPNFRPLFRTIVKGGKTQITTFTLHFWCQTLLYTFQTTNYYYVQTYNHC